MKLALILLLVAGPAMAQGVQVDARQVRDCLAEAGAGQGVPACVGGAAAACQDRPGGHTTLGISECLMAEMRIWGEVMNSAFARQAETLGERDSALVEQLRESQRAWSAYREAECGLRYALWIGGSIRTVMAGNCHLRKTAARAMELEYLGVME